VIFAIIPEHLSVFSIGLDKYQLGTFSGWDTSVIIVLKNRIPALKLDRRCWNMPNVEHIESIVVLRKCIRDILCDSVVDRFDPTSYMS
jgi:hypothetical protein